MVDHLVVGDAQDPRQELAVIRITALVDDADGFDEGLLENIIGHVAILDHHVDVVAYTAAVTFDELGHSAPIPGKVVIKQYPVT